MMTNLFSTFDPATSMNMCLNWVSTVLGLMLMPFGYWLMPSRIYMLLGMIIKKLSSEFSVILKNSNQGLTLMIVSVFMFILFNNMLGLMPYVFTSSSHLVFTLTMALPMWVSVMLFGWISNYQSMFAHLVPSGTPALLMPFMVLIETISNLIRPGSLAVRLTANMIAGHLLMSLLGNNMTSSSAYVMPMIFLVQVGLMMFEAAVSIIQAYVFSVLTTLYSSEVL
uniref:ATP synthase subunit a n=1 Tax=Nesidiocoris poppiusi TaxID=3059073 RepID=A0AAT9VVJ1_9HEMI|nr:ATP synthase F0 subunit 6 [Nesidiocoris poppiusi]WKW91651.1 ATP synthase F0 subunit 6 [Nesidiocoris poppiusi]